MSFCTAFRNSLRNSITLFCLLALCSAVNSCTQPATVEETQCIPQCDNHCGIDDGCGAICGCGDSLLCQEGACVSEPQPNLCGNGTIDDGETCDGNCPSVCDDQNACTIDTLAGTDSECSTNCVHTTINECNSGDGCCPQGCDSGNDSDCTAPCVDNCSGLGWECGSVCGESCGECSNGAQCTDGACHYQPVELSCADCSLRLVYLSQESNGPDSKRIRLAIDYAPANGEIPPRLADIHLRFGQPTSIESATEGPALLNAEKSLFKDPISGNAWKLRNDGTLQFFILATSNANTFVAGRLVEFSLLVDGSTTEPAVFSLVKRALTFAPTEPDNALQLSDYDSPVVVMP